MRISAFLLLFTAVGIGGCRSAPWPEPERLAAQAAGLDGAIAIQFVGAPVDQTEAELDTLTLPGAVELALTTHPDIQAAIARVRIAQAEADQERLLPNPVLSVAVRFVESGGDPVIEAGLSAELLALLQKPGRIKAADHRLRATAADAITATLDVLAEVKERYVGIQALDALMLVLDERRGLIDRLLEIAQSRLKAGEGTRLDVTTLQAQQAELTIEAVAVDQERRELRLQLARLIGQPSSEAAWGLSPWTHTSVDATDEAAWIAAAVEHRPEIQGLVWELSALGVEVKLARWLLTEGVEPGIEAERDDGVWSAGPSISAPLPVFDWGQARRALSDARRTEAAHQLVQAKRQTIEDVRRALVAFQLSMKAASHVREQLLPLLEQRRTEAESIYRAGQDDILVVILAEQELRAGRTRHIELERRAAEAFIRLERSVGGPAYMPEVTAPRQPHTDNPAAMPDR